MERSQAHKNTCRICLVCTYGTACYYLPGGGTQKSQQITRMRIHLSKSTSNGARVVVVEEVEIGSAHSDQEERTAEDASEVPTEYIVES